MNGGQDLGGQMGFGPVLPEPNEPIFHADWEARMLALNVAAGAMGHWTIDEIRHAREAIPPADYLSLSYYEIWYEGLRTVLQRHGFATPAELDSGAPGGTGTTPKRVLKGTDVPAVLRRGFPYEREAAAPARFKVGDKVRTIVMHPQHHTRLPRYARGKQGMVERVTGSLSSRSHRPWSCLAAPTTRTCREPQDKKRRNLAQGSGAIASCRIVWVRDYGWSRETSGVLRLRPSPPPRRLHRPRA